MMRVFDRILQEESRRSLTSIDDIDYLIISKGVEQVLIDECVEEFSLDAETVTKAEHISDSMGMRIIVEDFMPEDFKFVLKD